jgi:hypothetical protein
MPCTSAEFSAAAGYAAHTPPIPPVDSKWVSFLSWLTCNFPFISSLIFHFMFCVMHVTAVCAYSIYAQAEHAHCCQAATVRPAALQHMQHSCLSSARIPCSSWLPAATNIPNTNRHQPALRPVSNRASAPFGGQDILVMVLSDLPRPVLVTPVFKGI